MVNGGTKEPEVDGEIPGRTEVVGTQWQPLADGVTFPFEGFRYFYAGQVPEAELRQDVDVSAFARWIDAGVQRFVFEGYVRSRNETVPDTVEYRDAGPLPAGLPRPLSTTPKTVWSAPRTEMGT